MERTVNYRGSFYAELHIVPFTVNVIRARLPCPTHAPLRDCETFPSCVSLLMKNSEKSLSFVNNNEIARRIYIYIYTLRANETVKKHAPRVISLSARAWAGEKVNEPIASGTWLTLNGTSLLLRAIGHNPSPFLSLVSLSSPRRSSTPLAVALHHSRHIIGGVLKYSINKALCMSYSSIGWEALDSEQTKTVSLGKFLSFVKFIRTKLRIFTNTNLLLSKKEKRERIYKILFYKNI